VTLATTPKRKPPTLEQRAAKVVTDAIRYARMSPADKERRRAQLRANRAKHAAASVRPRQPEPGVVYRPLTPEQRRQRLENQRARYRAKRVLHLVIADHSRHGVSSAIVSPAEVPDPVRGSYALAPHACSVPGTAPYITLSWGKTDAVFPAMDGGLALRLGDDLVPVPAPLGVLVERLIGQRDHLNRRRSSGQRMALSRPLRRTAHRV
jgi:hypothetical protein